MSVLWVVYLLVMYGYSVTEVFSLSYILFATPAACHNVNYIFHFTCQFCLNFEVDTRMVKFYHVVGNGHVPHHVLVHFITFGSLRLEFLRTNLALVKILFKFDGCLLLLISFILLIGFFSFTLADKMGKVFFIVRSRMGFLGLCVVIKVIMSSSLLGFFFIFLSSSSGILFAF